MRAVCIRMLAVRISIISITWVLIFGGLSVAVAACSGASAPEIPAAVTGQSATDPTEPSRSASSSTSGPNSPNAAPPNAPAAAPTPANTPPGCTLEAEPNGADDRANAFAACAVGALADSKDNDYLRVVAPLNGSTIMVVEHQETHGKVLYRVSRDWGGLPLSFNTSFTDGSPRIQTTPGAAYIFRLTFPTGKDADDDDDKPGPGGANSNRPYELRVRFE